MAVYSPIPSNLAIKNTKSHAPTIRTAKHYYFKPTTNDSDDLTLRCAQLLAAAMLSK
jgi:hypothetical protein